MMGFFYPRQGNSYLEKQAETGTLIGSELNLIIAILKTGSQVQK